LSVHPGRLRFSARAGSGSNRNHRRRLGHRG
jgi:hypothetical protein